MNTQQLKKRSKLLSLVLRHNPAHLQLELDRHGWAEIEILLERMNNRGITTSRELLDEIVESNNKQRFRLSDDGLKIRANQGHSIDIDLELEQLSPPEFLYHGTALTSVPSILQTGIQKRKRQHVHLSADRETAHLVGSRHGKPQILTISSNEMTEKGFLFYRSENGVWLTDEVPPEFIETTDWKPQPGNLKAIKGDITTLAVDIIVNAANSSLLCGGGVDGAIHRKAGKDLVHECRLLSGCKTGQAKVTDAYELPAKRIIHTVGPVWNGGGGNEALLLERCYRNSLEIALSEGHRSIAFPCISTGVYRYPLAQAAQIAVNVCREFQDRIEITFCCFDDENLSLYRNLIQGNTK